MNRFKNIKKKYDHLSIQKDLAMSQYALKKKALKRASKALIDTEKARLILQEVAQKTQQNLQLHISDIVSLALESVLDNAPEFIVNIIQRRNKTEVDLMFKRGNKSMPPVGSSGGGLLDLTSFALRIAMWSLNKNRATIVLDEPFKFLSAGYQAAASKLVKTISDKLGIQFIIISHQEDAISYSDRVFSLSKPNKISKVRVHERSG